MCGVTAKWAASRAALRAAVVVADFHAAFAGSLSLFLGSWIDEFLKGTPQLVDKALTAARTTLVTLTESDRTGEHTYAGGLGRAHQKMFDWLDVTLDA